MKTSCIRFGGRSAASLASVLFVGALAACGGGGSADASDPTVLADGFSRFAGTVTDETGAPLAGAEVRLPFANSVGWGGQTDAAGHYSFDAKASDYAGVSPVAMTINKDGYRPRTVLYAGVAPSTAYSFTSDTTTSPAKLKPEQVVPIGSSGLSHVGNDMYGGAINSQLQTASRGTGLAFEIGPWSATMKSQYRTATIEFIARGVDGLECKNLVGIAAGAAAPFQYIAGSDSSGGFSRYRLTLDVSNIAADAVLTAVVKSGDCPGSPSDLYDDFEFSELLVTYGS
jgi:hypothetical protein